MLDLFLTALLAIVPGDALPPAPSGLSAPFHGELPPEPLPDSAAGRAAAAFIRAVNEGTPEAVRAFEEPYRSSAQQRVVTLDERVSRFAQIHADLAPLTVRRVVDRPEGPLTVMALAGNGSTVSMDFVPAAGEPGRVDGVRLAIGGPDVAPNALTAQQVADAVRAAARALEEGYVFPETGAKMATTVLSKLDQGGYDALTDDVALAAALTTDLRAVSHDLHLGVQVAPPRPAAEEHDPGAELRQMASDNFGFREVQVLPGNIGYLRFDFFIEGEDAEETAAGAMSFLRNCDAIIFDLRTNGGGSPEMIRFLTSYLFETPTHLNDMIDRDGNTVEEYWTLAEVPGGRPRAGLPVYVLTSGRSFSGAEEFCYNLKNLKRATLVGERTGGGAHPVRGEGIGGRLLLRVPFMRANNPITKTNWEGVGVEPDVPVSADGALERALELARGAAASVEHHSR
ncbi:MAG: S41 family peptidase [Phycisphaerales bacterium]|nr:S41 family peptidase [Phycisphaerales bacterium]